MLNITVLPFEGECLWKGEKKALWLEDYPRLCSCKRSRSDWISFQVFLYCGIILHLELFLTVGCMVEENISLWFSWPILGKTWD